MGQPQRSAGTAAATTALFIVIAVVSVTLAIYTDLNLFARLGISLPAGIVAAAIVFALSNKRRES